MAKRPPRVVWLPPTTSNSVGQQAAGAESSWKRFIIEIAGVVGDTTVGEVPVVIDGADDATNAVDSISDLYNSTYRLRRLVGKIFIAPNPNTDPQSLTPRVLGITAGFIIRRTEPTTGTSFAGLTANGTLFNPSLITNANDPWIWRRSWVLGVQRAGGVAVDQAFPVLPASNFGTQGASAVDGPHIDQKTARIVGPEERLFLDVSATILTSDIGDGEPTIVNVAYELRVLASIRSGSGNRRNASR